MLKKMFKPTCYQVATSLFGDRNGLVTLPVLSGPAKGLKMRLDLRGGQDAYFLGKYDRAILTQVMPLIQPGWTIWDCGAYIGFYTLVFARRVGPKGRVVAFDLDRRNLEFAKENTRLNRFSNVEFIEAAIGAPLGEVDFVIDPSTNSHLSGTYVGDQAMQEVWRSRDRDKPRGRVECISLDQAIIDKRLPKPKFIKLDIDGAEKEALGHGSFVFSKIRPLVLLELHNPQCDAVAWEFSRRFSYELKSVFSGQIIKNGRDVNGTLLCQPV